MSFISLFFLLFNFITANAVKLTLKQDMRKLQEQLKPEEIGQFLHSIKNLPQLAEFLDPSRSRLNFDFYFYYNTYGCADTRVFDWRRISNILTYGGLSREDRLILLNSNCLIQWPGFLTLEPRDLRFLMRVLPETNPLLSLSGFNGDQSFRIHVITQDKERWATLIDIASVNRDFNFIPGIDLLFKKKIVGPNNFGTSHFSLIGPQAIDSCYRNSSQSKERHKCSWLVFSMENNYKNFTAIDIFNWTLNIGITIKYDSSSRVISFLQTHFNKLISACQVEELKNFIEGFSAIIIFKKLRNQEISKHSIFDVFKIIFSIESMDTKFLAVEFYNWLDLNSEYFNIDSEFLNDTLLKKLIFKLLSKVKSKKQADYFLKFFIEKRQFCQLKYFKKFLNNNFNPEKPSHELIKAFRHVSWISGRDGGFKFFQIIKSFLEFDFRASFLRRISFDHPEHGVQSNSISISIHLGEESFINTSLFNCVYKSLLNNDTLIYPLKIDVTTSNLLKNLMKDSIDLESIIQIYWKLLGDEANGFVRYNENEDDFDLNYPPELTPNPWTHPNILASIGCVMTLAYLHGIKLKGWRMNRIIFNTAFRIDLSSVTKKEDEEYGEDDFLMFYSVNDYLNEIESSDDERIIESLSELINVNKSLKPNTKKALENYRNNLLKKDENGFYSFDSEPTQIWASKIFQFIEDGHENILNGDDLLTAIQPYLMTLNLTPDLIEQDVERITKTPETRRVTAKDAARIQIYSFFLGLQPLTRFLHAYEVYEELFRE